MYDILIYTEFMPKSFTDIGSYILGELTESGQGFLVLTIDEMNAKKMPHGQIFKCDGQKLILLGSVPWYPKALLPLEEQKLLIVGEYVQYCFFNDNGLTGTRERIATHEGSPQSRGPLRRGCLIEKTPIVVGMARQVYQRQGTVWENLEQGLPADNREVAGFEAVSGFSLKEIYAAGWHGELWQFDGRAWHAINSPTNSLITNMCFGGDGFVYACGRNGLFLRGRNNKWQVIASDMESNDFWGITWFKDKLYLSSMNGLFSWDGQELQAISYGDEKPSSFYQLAASKNVLWSIGAKDVLSFDDKKWSRIG